jgi:hypothetical protein
MAKAVFDIGCRVSSGKHIDRTGVPQAVDGIDGSETFGWQGHGEVFSAEPIDAVSGEFFTALIDKKTLLKGRLWGWPESRDVELEELSGLGFQFDESEAAAFSEDGEGFLLGVKVVQVESGHFRGSGAGIKEEVEEGVIPYAFLSLQIDDMKELENLFRVEEPDEGFLGALLGNGENALSEVTLLRIEEADHFGEGLEGSESLIAGSGQIVTLGLEIIEEGEDEI